MAVEPNPLQFSAPIPGQSLTTEPKGRPWETPPTYSTEEEALNFYLSQLEVTDRVQQVIQLLDSGFPAADLVDALTLGGVMEGLHTIDVAVLIAPALFEMVKGIAEASGTEYKDGITEEDDGSVPSHIIQMALNKPQAEELVDQVEEEELENIMQTAGGLMSRPEDEEELIDNMPLSEEEQIDGII